MEIINHLIRTGWSIRTKTHLLQRVKQRWWINSGLTLAMFVTLVENSSEIIPALLGCSLGAIYLQADQWGIPRSFSTSPPSTTHIHTKLGHNVVVMMGQRLRRRPNITPTLIIIYPANTIHWPNAGLMLGRRRRRWANINPALGQCIVFVGLCLLHENCTQQTRDIGTMLVHRLRRWPNTKTRLVIISCLLEFYSKRKIFV